MELGRELFGAARDGNATRVRELVAQGADMNERRAGGATALHMAAGFGHEGVTRTLLALGADKEIESDGGMRPLHVAAMSGHVEVTRGLVQSGVLLDTQTAHGTAHAISLHHGHPQVTSLLEAAVQSRLRSAAAAANQAGGS